MIQLHSFSATKSQYEYQFKKWKMSKNRKSTEWRALARHIRAREAQGKQAQVYYKGQLVSHQKVAREISRHGLASAGSLNGLDLPVPSGFSIRSPIVVEEVEGHFHKDLPLILFENVLRGGSNNDSVTDSSSRISVLDPPEEQPGEEKCFDIHFRRADTPNIRPSSFGATLNFLAPSNTLLQEVAQYHAKIIIPTLRAILPESQLGTCFHTMSTSSLRNGIDGAICNRDFSSDYMRVLVFLLSNNQIDLDDFPLKVIWNYLRTRANPEWIERICNKNSGPTGPELKRRLFQCAILVGDSGAVDALLNVDGVKREAKDSIFVIKGERYTTLELSLGFGIPSVTEVLLRHGLQPAVFLSTINLQGDREEDQLPGIGGSAEIMARLIRIDAPFDLEIASGYVRRTWLERLLFRFRSEGALKCFEAASSEQLRRWSQSRTVVGSGIVDPVVNLLKGIDEDCIDPVMKAMLRAGVELGERVFYTAINNLAGNGRLDSVQMLLSKYQLRPTVETLVQATKSGNRQLVHRLVKMGAGPVGFTKERHNRGYADFWKFESPFVEALQARDFELVQYFEDHGAIAALPSGDLFVAAWKAAIKAGNEETLSKMLHRMRDAQDDKWPLKLIQVSFDEGREDLALVLLSVDEAAYIPFYRGGTNITPPGPTRGLFSSM
ncbi:hypothetical protein V8F33_011016 [Rhypophila sp. PSN 637]